MQKTQDMTKGSISKQILTFALPLMLGNIFQMLYNTVDSIVVGNFVGYRGEEFASVSIDLRSGTITVICRPRDLTAIEKELALVCPAANP